MTATPGPSASRALAALVASFLVLGALWSVCVPAFEKPDEAGHLAYVQLVAREWRLPVQGRERGPFEEAESQQPPLYYLAAALVERAGAALGVPPVDLDLWASRINPRYPREVVTAGSELNFMVHAPGEWPPPGLLLQRAFALVLAAAAILATFAVARVAFGGRDGPALFAAALVALLPQVTFLAGDVTNDTLAWLVGALLLLALLRLREAEPQEAPRRWLEIGVLGGVAILTKATLIALLPLTFFAFPRRATRRDVLQGLVIWCASLALIGGWWLVRNVALYGDLPGRQELASPGDFPWLHPKTLADPYFRGPFWALTWESFVGLFGAANVRMHHLIHLAATWLAALALFGLVLYTVRLLRHRFAADARPGLWTLGLLGTAGGLAVSALVYYNLTVTQPQGRYLFYVLPVWGVLAATGLDSLADQVADHAGPRPGQRLRHLGTAALLAVALVVNVYALFRVVVPTYAPAGCAGFGWPAGGVTFVP